MKIDIFVILKIVGLALILLGHFILCLTNSVILFSLVTAAGLTLMVVDERLFRDNKETFADDENHDLGD